MWTARLWRLQQQQEEETRLRRSCGPRWPEEPPTWTEVRSRPDDAASPRAAARCREKRREKEARWKKKKKKKKKKKEEKRRMLMMMMMMMSQAIRTDETESPAAPPRRTGPRCSAAAQRTARPDPAPLADSSSFPTHKRQNTPKAFLGNNNKQASL